MSSTHSETNSLSSKLGALATSILIGSIISLATHLPAYADPANGIGYADDIDFGDEEEDDGGLFDIEETIETVEDKDSLFAQFAASKNWSGCANTRVGNTYRNIFGIRAFGYFQEISHCWRGGTVTSARLVNRWAEIYSYPLVNFNGHIGQWKSNNTFWTQGSFSACLGWRGVGCFMNYTPIVRMWPTGFGRVGYGYRAIGSPVDEDLVKENWDGIFLADDLDEVTKKEFHALVQNQNYTTRSTPDSSPLIGLSLVGLSLFSFKKLRSL
ncbi:MAG: hypothetical protein MH825_10745 [Cyanobacteria bacterium]|nr:hypothetical protein [Cyanobacteriota bacterium]